MYQPSSQESNESESSDTEVQISHDAEKRQSLDSFLLLSNLEPLRSVLTQPWAAVTQKTRAHYIKKASNAVAEVLRTVAPGSAASLWDAVKDSDEVGKQLVNGSTRTGNNLLFVISESIKQASSRETRRQLISLVSSKVSFSKLQQYIPNLTRYQFTASRRYGLEVGAGLQADTPSKQIRERVDP